MRSVPTAAEHFDQQHAGAHATAQDIDVVALVIECGGLSGDDLQIRIDATDITIIEDELGFLRGSGGLALLLLFVGKDAECDEIVLDLLVGVKDRLPIVGCGAVVIGERLLGETAPPTAIEERFAEGRAQCIDEARLVEERGDGCALEARSCAEIQRRKVGGAGDANLFVGCCGAALGGGDVGTTLE